MLLHDFIIARGITNLIDVDGMIYAPVADLLRLFVKYGFAAFVLFCFILVAVCFLICCNRSSKDD